MLSDRIASDERAPVAVGTQVRVRNALGSWAGGFEVVSVTPTGYLLRRLSDGWLLPRAISAGEVRKA
jgi:hypothetical protein